MKPTILAFILVCNAACGGRSSRISSPAPSGAYEFVVTSTVTGAVTLIDANLTANGNQSSANGSAQVQVLSLQKKIWYVNGVCPGKTPGQNEVTATVAGNGIALGFNEGGSSVPAQGTITGTTINANYSISGSDCPDLQGIVGYPPGTDLGGVIGNQTQNLSGTFAGTLTLPTGVDDAVLTLTESSDHSLMVAATLTGPVDNGTFTSSGTAIGNIMSVSVSANGQDFNLLGYYDSLGIYTGVPNSMLVFNSDTLSQAGLLLHQ